MLDRTSVTLAAATAAVDAMGAAIVKATGAAGAAAAMLVTATMAMTALATASTVASEAGIVVRELRARGTSPPRQAASQLTTEPTSSRRRR